MNKSNNAQQLRRKAVFALAFAFCLPATLRATEIVNVGNHLLLPNTPNQEIDIFVTNDRATSVNLQGLSFYVQVADGGPVLGAILGDNEHIIGPGITGTVITPPEIFSVMNDGVQDGNPGQVFGKQIISLDLETSQNHTFIAQPGLSTVLLGAIMVDTTGFFSGSWSLAMNNTLIGPTFITGWGNVTDPLSPSDPIGELITDGSISIATPEPASVVLGALAIAGLTIVSIRKRRARRSA